MAHESTGELERYKDLCDRVMSGESWHGPSVFGALESVTAKMAFARVGACPFTIWQLVRHMTAWKRVVLDRLEGNEADLPDEDNWPRQPRASAEEWQRARDELFGVHTELQDKVDRLGVADLSNPAAEGSWPRYLYLHGVLHHDVYHSAQIVTLKKLLS